MQTFNSSKAQQKPSGPWRWSRGGAGTPRDVPRVDQGHVAGAPSNPGKVMGREKLTPKLKVVNMISATLALLPPAVLHGSEGTGGSEHVGTPAQSPLLAPGIAGLCLAVLVPSWHPPRTWLRTGPRKPPLAQWLCSWLGSGWDGGAARLFRLRSCAKLSVTAPLAGEPFSPSSTL